MLEHQHNMFEEIINITKEIIEQQIVIKERTESLQTLNKTLEGKSMELQAVLATSQAQLQTEISIPIELINQLAGSVKQLKDEQKTRFGQLLLSLGTAHGQFEKQELILEQNKRDSEIKDDCHGIQAWSGSRGQSVNSDLADHHLTILDIQEQHGSDSPNNEDPASQSENLADKSEEEDIASKIGENTDSKGTGM